jgi:hypothetical protein
VSQEVPVVWSILIWWLQKLDLVLPLQLFLQRWSQRGVIRNYSLCCTNIYNFISHLSYGKPSIKHIGRLTHCQYFILALQTNTKSRRLCCDISGANTDTYRCKLNKVIMIQYFVNWSQDGGNLWDVYVRVCVRVCTHTHTHMDRG